MKNKPIKIIIILALIILTFLSIFTCIETYVMRNSVSYMPIISIFFLFIILVLFAIISLRKNIFINNRNEKILNIILNYYSNVECNIFDYCNTLDLYNSGILPYHDDSYGNFSTTYRENNKEYTFCNIALETIVANGEQNIFSEEFFKGQLYIIDLQKNIDGYIKIQTKNNDLLNIMKEPSKEDQKIKLEDIELTEKFNIYSNNEHDCFYILNAFVINKLKVLQQKYGYINIYIEKNKAFIIIK